MEQEIIKISSNSITSILNKGDYAKKIIELIGEDNLIREVSFAVQAALSNNILADATPNSIAQSVYNVAISGLTLNPIMKFAALTPRRNKSGQWEALLTPMYGGLTKLVTDTGSVKKIVAHPVYKQDYFEYSLGTQMGLIHKPVLCKREPTDIIAFYAIGTLKDGDTQFEVMAIDEINAIRERSDGYKAFKNGKVSTTIWETDYAEMGRKTVIKRLIKYLPKSSNNEKWENVMEAVKLDNKDYPASEQQYGYIERLLRTSTFGHEERNDIEEQLSGELTISDAESLIEDLLNNQQDSIRDSANASSTEINKRLNNL